MLSKIRRFLAVITFILITLLFLDFTGTIHTWFGWLAKIQFLPALLALNFGVIILLVVITLLVGRVYCSIICPLGIMQDTVSWLNGQRKNKRYRFSYSPAKNILRYTVLGVFILAAIAGIGSFIALLAPYSAYGRIVSNLFAPIYYWGNNLFASIAERMGSYAFYEISVWIKSLPTLIVASITFVFLVVLSWRHGRTYCNTICPVGTVLGVVSRYSLLSINIDKNKCNACGLCSRKCKSSCIDGTSHSIDYSRCVVCMDCIETCRHGAISLGLRKSRKHLIKRNIDTLSDNGQIDDNRRSFITLTAVLSSTAILKSQEKKVDGGLAVIEDKLIPNRTTPILPPGALSARNLAQRCTACQLCVSACPNEVIRPSTKLQNLMQPELSYERGYCRPECTKCSEVCPSGAIQPITRADKSSTQIGHAVWIKKNCIPLTDGVECGNCARHCPTGAITMAPSEPSNPDSKKIPIINTEKCIGCGACEHLCPARPFSSIYIEGHERHRIV